ncbi:hypothetical protein AVEN_108801-1 [Araneus ventricosus]|uniref:Uncharacterized protein n=1 Tax=Araneus ventricosus TaxID=182803 RepID=A0A4Y2CEF0_ARAVE|nr:hypothetical protein AVEN_108801-1 [Araneus ventricosus]
MTCLIFRLEWVEKKPALGQMEWSADELPALEERGSLGRRVAAQMSSSFLITVQKYEVRVRLNEWDRGSGGRNKTRDYQTHIY